MRQIAVFASGSGTNFQSLVEQSGKSYQVVLLVCDCHDAFVVTRARKLGIPSFVFDPRTYQTKSVYEINILKQLQVFNVTFIALAGYMRLIGPILLEAYPDQIINIHPSLLPSFIGKDAIGQAMSYGVKVTGVTVHYIDCEMDRGTIIAQDVISINERMTREELTQKIQAIERELYPKVLRQILTKGRNNDETRIDQCIG